MKKLSTTDTKDHISDQAPDSFGLCFRTDCATVHQCLRGLAAQDINDKRLILSIVNPILTDPKGKTACRFFRPVEKIRMAFGFKKAMDKVPSGNIRHVRASLLLQMCRRNYYYYLNGEKAIDPQLQQEIAAILIQNGLTEPVEFDRYEWHYAW